MKIKTTAGLFAVLALALLVAACPNNNGTPEPNESGPRFTGLSLDGKKILVIFDKALSGTPDTAKITVKKGEATLAYGQGKDYTLSIEGKNLIITLKTAPVGKEQYTVKLQAGAVQDASGKNSEAPASSTKTTLTVGIIPAIQGSLAFKTDSNTVLELGFNTPVAIADSAGIKVETKASGEGAESQAVNATSKVSGSDSTKLEITLGSAATDGNTYRVRVEAGGIRATSSELVNGVELSSTEVTYLIVPALNTAIPPYILRDTIIATFNRQIALKDWNKVKVHKNPTEANEEVSLTKAGITVDTVDKTQLNITLPTTVTDGEVYRLALEAGAVIEDGDDANENKAIAPTNLDISIAAAPALDSNNIPYLEKRKIVVPFNTQITILDITKIKYQLKANAGIPAFDAAITPTTAPSVVNNTNLEIPLNDASARDQVYRISLDTGALGGKNAAPTGKINPLDKDMTVSGPTLTNVKTVFVSKSKLSVTFPIDVILLDASVIKVEKKDEGKAFETVTPDSIEVDNTNAQKVNITLDQEATLYTQTWKLVFPIGSVESLSGIANATELVTDELKPRLSDIYTWTEATPAGDTKDTSGDDANWWSARYAHTSVVFDEKIWILGGSDGPGKNLNDVWSSTDGSTWTRITAAANWAARLSHASTVFDNGDGNGEKIWVLGGRNTRDNGLNDVWYSTDGSTWTRKTAAANWAIRSAHTSVVFDGKIWVLGGNVNTRSSTESWYSTDGGTWTKATNTHIGFDSHDSVIFDNRIWNLSGYLYSNTVSSSANPVKAWVAEKAATWPGRQASSAVVFQKKIWILGGASTNNVAKNAVWSFGPTAP